MIAPAGGGGGKRELSVVELTVVSAVIELVVGRVAVAVWLVGTWRVSAVGVDGGIDFVYSDSVLGCLGLVVVSVLLLVSDSLHPELDAPWFVLCFGCVVYYTAIGHSGVVAVV